MTETAQMEIRRVRVGQCIGGVGALTSLLALADGTVLVGTTTTGSDMPVLLRFDPWTGEVRDTGVRFPAKGRSGDRAYGIGDKIHDALIHGGGPWEGWCLLGHGSHIWWDEGGWPFSPRIFAGGAVHAWHPQTGELRHLGIPVANNTVHGLYGGDGFAVGYSLPDNHFFSLDYESGQMTDLGRISAYCCHAFICQGRKAYGVYRRSVGRQRGDLVVADDAAAFLLVYDHDRRELERTDILISELDTNIRFNSGMDGWCKRPGRETLIGARVNGDLFELDPRRRTLRNLGRAVSPPRPQLTDAQTRRMGGKLCRRIEGCERIPAMIGADEHRIIGVAGFPVMRLFALEASGERIDYGPVNREAEMCYFHSMAVVRRPGACRLVLAETDAQPDLYVVDGEFLASSSNPSSDSVRNPFSKEMHHVSQVA